MSEISETFFDEMTDKSKWGPGPWQGEADRVEFEHLGFPCLIRRNMIHGHLCGYVAVSPGHPWHGTLPGDAQAHGGVNYAAPCKEDVCHVPKPGETDDVWWIGFDCGHGGIDYQPSLEAYMRRRLPELPDDLRGLKERFPLPSFMQPRYRTIDYVRVQCEALAAQAKEAAG